MTSPLRRLLVRGVVAGAAGTAVMGLCEYAHVRLRRPASAPIDYDVSGHVPLAAARVLRLRLRTDEESGVLFLVTQAGYGSAFGIVAALLGVSGLTPRRQAILFFALTESLALSVFPTLGDTPPPWRWRAEPLLTSVVQHAIYAGVVVGTLRGLARARCETDVGGG